jgi:RNA polymerase sigma factor (sigma-70 family)
MEHSIESDYDLIVACRINDTRAWEQLLDRYQRLVFSIPLNYGLSHDDAAEITQITFTILLQSLETLHEDSHLGAWLAVVARRHTWRLLERYRHEQASDDTEVSRSLDSSDPNTNDELERLEVLEWLHTGLTRLDQRCRKLIIALYLDPQQASYTEIGERFGIPVGSVGPTRARCLKRLKQVLEEC